MTKPANTGLLTEGQAIIAIIVLAIGVLFFVVWALS